MAIKTVEISLKARKQLKKLPIHIINKLDAWIAAVEREGLASIRKIPGYHDEPLRGNRQGQRSIRLSKAYRAIYTIKNGRVAEFVRIEEVTKHGY